MVQTASKPHPTRGRTTLIARARRKKGAGCRFKEWRERPGCDGRNCRGAHSVVGVCLLSISSIVSTPHPAPRTPHPAPRTPPPAPCTLHPAPALPPHPHPYYVPITAYIFDLDGTLLIPGSGHAHIPCAEAAACKSLFRNPLTSAEAGGAFLRSSPAGRLLQHRQEMESWMAPVFRDLSAGMVKHTRFQGIVASFGAAAVSENIVSGSTRRR